MAGPGIRITLFLIPEGVGSFVGPAKVSGPLHAHVLCRVTQSGRNGPRADGEDPTQLLVPEIVGDFQDPKSRSNEARGRGTRRKVEVVRREIKRMSTGGGDVHGQ